MTDIDDDKKQLAKRLLQAATPGAEGLWTGLEKGQPTLTVTTIQRAEDVPYHWDVFEKMYDPDFILLGADHPIREREVRAKGIFFTTNIQPLKCNENTYILDTGDWAAQGRTSGSGGDIRVDFVLDRKQLEEMAGMSYETAQGLLPAAERAKSGIMR